MKNRVFLMTAACTLVLSACGGGGGGGNAPAPGPVSSLSAITAASSTKVAANGYVGSAAITESSASLSGMLTGVSVGRADVSVVSPVLDLIRRVRPGATSQLLTGITLSEPCTGGGVLVIEANLRNPDIISNGDSIAFTAKNCVEDGDTLNGGFSATFSNVTGNVMNSYVWGATLDTRFNNFSVMSGSDTVSANGDMRIAMAQTSVTNYTISVSGNSLQTLEQRAGVTLASRTLADYSMTGSANNTTVTSAASFSISGTTGALGQFSYTVKNLQPFVSMGSSMPYTGSLIVQGASSSVTLNAVSPTTVRLSFSAKGDGVITQVSNLTWVDLLMSI